MAEGSYQVIARRWRPQQFDEIVGQEHIVRTLKNAIETNRIGHAYLFVGPRGTGKTTTARIFAKALNCTGGPKTNPPADDPVCQAIVAGACMDVIEIDAATNRSIEDAKTIREECQFAPTQCQFKIFIIDEVHQLTKEAFNTLLKTLEEPPPHIKFIFATTESDKVLPTITSRCQRFEFQPIPEEKIAGRLKEIVAADGVEADDAALLAIARLANGGMRDSQSILDQVISFCGKKISAPDVLDIYGLASAEEIQALTAAMAAGDYARVISLSDKFVSEGRDLLRVLQHAQARIREALLVSIREKGATAFLGTSLATEQLLRMLETLQAGEAGVRGGLSERANFEVALLKAVEQSRSRAIDTLIKEISSLAAGLPQEAGQKKIESTPPAALPTVAVDAKENPAPGKISVPPTSLGKTPLPGPMAGAGERPIHAGIPEEDPAPKKMSRKPPAPTPPADAPFADGPPLEQMTGIEEAEAAELRAGGSSAGWDGELVPEIPAAYPGSPDFQQAVHALPAGIRTLLHAGFHAEFTVLREVPESRYLHVASAPAKAVAEEIDDIGLGED